MAEEVEIVSAEDVKPGEIAKKMTFGGEEFEVLFAKGNPGKTREELDSLIRAQRIAEKALYEVLPLLKPGAVEREIAAELTYRMRLYGAEANSFDPIVVTGAKSSMPHGVPGDEVIKSGDFVTMDFGCLKNGYCSDMTRTVAIGSATDEMRNVYCTVLEAQKAGIAVARPGVTGAEIHNAGAKVIADAGYGAYFGHGFGHGVGMSQWGAYALAEEGKSAEEIIQHYFTNVDIIQMW